MVQHGAASCAEEKPDIESWWRQDGVCMAHDVYLTTMKGIVSIRQRHAGRQRVTFDAIDTVKGCLACSRYGLPMTLIKKLWKQVQRMASQCTDAVITGKPWCPSVTQRHCRQWCVLHRQGHCMDDMTLEEFRHQPVFEEDVTRLLA